ncbi:hypothetical protein Ait01nite_083680 [Actinoplanes italicus]|uniref:Uncharacterized protein n=1 Tax=Actinoplanes italicus TaxID=113567 RepID=A0A2T0JXT8_9ACTN|nr:hypothetical protein [Actinoplanes italicus]PRX12980.1 hypothetical protein CLV67_126105 [Actinoplanes italicus]GIE35323.1 hypothetical protein Ait01nite_083680 [Actinoplanes italicus]
MKPLSELLLEVKADAPPPRYGVEQVVAAGRRRRRRRNTGWAIVAAAALAAVIGVPQFITRADGGPPVLPAVPTPEVSGPVFAFRGYSAGAYEAGDASWLYRDYSGAHVYRAGTQESVGRLEVYRPGVVPDEGPELGYQQNRLKRNIMVWKYTDDAYAILTPDEGSGLTEADLRALADRFNPGGGRAIRIAYRVGYMPVGYRIFEVISQPGAEVNVSNVTLRNPAGVDLAFRVGMRPGQAVQPECRENGSGMTTYNEIPVEDALCVLPLAGDRFLQIDGGGLPLSEVRRIFESTVADRDLADEAKWYPVDEAFPTSARLGTG